MNIKRILQICVAFLIVIGIIFIGWRWWHSGTVIITAPDDNYTLRIENEAGQELAKKKSSELKRRLNRGQYAVFADYNGSTSTMVVEISPRSTTKVALKPEPQKLVEDLSDRPARNVSVQNSNVIFVVPTTQIANRYVGESGITQPYLTDLFGIKDLQANNQYGIAITNQGKLYEIVNNNKQDITSTIFTKLTSTSKIALGVNASNFALSAGKDVFVKQQGELVARKVFSTKDADANIAYDGERKLAVFSIPSGYPHTDNEDAKLNEVNFEEYQGGGLTILDINSQKKQVLDEGRIVVAAAWSPSRKLLAYALDSVIKIYDTEKNAVVGTIEKKQIKTLPISWCDENRVTFGDTLGLWLYDMENKSTNLLTKQNDLTSIACTQNQVYFGTSSPSNDGGLFRIMFTKAENDSLIDKLNNVLPRTDDHFEITYSIANNKPVVTIKTFAPRPVQGVDYSAQNNGASYDELVNLYREEALAYLKDSGIDPSLVQINFEAY